MSAFKWTIACAVLAMPSTLLASTADGIIITHFESLERMSFQRVGEVALDDPQRAQPASMTFDALGRSFVLVLESNTSLVSSMSRTAIADNVDVYRGRLTDNPRSWARIVVVDGVPRGLVFDGDELLAIEAPGDGIVQSTSPVIYRLADMIVAPGALSCASAGSSTNGAELYEAIVSELNTALAQGPGAVDEIKFGAIGDFEFTSAMGGSAETAIITRLNNVDGIFSNDLGIQITVETIETFPDPADPFSDVTDTTTLLNELGLYRQGNPAQNQQGLTHLYTGRDLDGSTVGVAYTGALCSTRFGAALTEGNRGANVDSLISAHEIGHNFGAPHDAEVGSACEAEADTFLMAATVNGSNQFSPCSISEMSDNIAAASCITPLPGVDVTVSATGQPTSVFLGNAANITFDIENNGTLQATNVAADVTLPNNVSLIAAAASQGTCTSGASTVSCSMGDIAGSSGGTVTVTASTLAAGTAIFSATVSADADDDPMNNQRLLQVEVVPAVNLVVNSPSSAQVNVDQSATVSTTLANTSSLNATGVSVTITLDAGLRADSATWTAGSCTVAAQQVDCAAGTLTSQATSTLTLGVTGLAAGSLGYTVAMASVEADANPADNSASGTVTVSSPSSSDDDEGGGAVGAVFLWLLGGALFWRRRRSPA